MALDNSPTIIVIGGTDGVGKSTLVERLITQQWGAVSSATIKHRSIFDANPHLVEMISKAGLNKYLAHLDPTARFLFCLHAIRQSLTNLDNSDVVLYDGYWYKYAARELAHGMPASLLEAVDSFLPKPKAILHIHLDPAVAATRRESFTLLERGGDAQHQTAAFISYQSKVQSQWDQINQHLQGIPIYNLDGGLNKADLYVTACNYLSELSRNGAV